jgi:hypothetical protein
MAKEKPAFTASQLKRLVNERQKLIESLSAQKKSLVALRSVLNILTRAKQSEAVLKRQQRVIDSQEKNIEKLSTVVISLTKIIHA